ncbi:MAG TPA: hypothetical protein VM899_14665 [Rubellimicrobium sp.]|jgi:hypothetical protein|nr:hypothetical protein [Rubellimicrobium sp.]
MTLATLDAPGPAILPKAPRPSFHPRIEPVPLPHLTEEEWAHIQARLRATGIPVEAEDDQALVRTMGTAGLLGLALTTLTAWGFWALIS